MPPWGPRHDVAVRRIRNILRTHIAASARTLEQKISDAGPTNQRVDPHILTVARGLLVQQGEVVTVQQTGVRWYHLATENADVVEKRISELDTVHQQTQRRQFVVLLGQALEIATFRALLGQTTLNYFGNYPDLDAHDDSTLYTKEEPPSSLSGRHIPSGKKLDFLIQHAQGGYAGIEVKNIREWMYPDRLEVRELLFKCCALDVVPVLISRRIHYSTFSVLNPCGVVIHQTYNQLYPDSARELATKVRDKQLLGYHDVRLGNQPDQRLVRFIHENLPRLLLSSRVSFDAFKDLLFFMRMGFTATNRSPPASNAGCAASLKISRSLSARRRKTKASRLNDRGGEINRPVIPVRDTDGAVGVT